MRLEEAPRPTAWSWNSRRPGLTTLARFVLVVSRNSAQTGLQPHQDTGSQPAPPSSRKTPRSRRGYSDALTNDFVGAAESLSHQRIRPAPRIKASAPRCFKSESSWGGRSCNGPIDADVRDLRFGVTANTWKAKVEWNRSCDCRERATALSLCDFYLDPDPLRVCECWGD